MMPVTSAPTRTPSRGLEKRVNRLVNHASFCSGSTALDMVVMPVISTAKPIRIVPTPFFFSLLHIYSKMPINASTGLKEVGLSSWMNRLSPCKPERLKIQLVTVVPKPTTITVVALELWMTAVTHRPRKKPLRGLSVSLLRIFCSWPPACFSSALPMMSIPNKNRARPPSSGKTLKMVISVFLTLS